MTEEPDHRNPGEIYADGRDGYIYDQGYLDGLDQARFSVLKVVEMVDDNEITATQALEGVALGLARSMDILQATWAWTADLDPRDDEGDNDE
jgi:hypothetical protein